jgi:ABC-type branched-subunit amino acid transport system permease subunit
MAVLNPAFWIFVAAIAGIYAIMALGLYVQFSLAGLPNFGHVAFMAVAAYTMAILVARYAWPLASPRPSPSPSCSAFPQCGCAPTISRSRPWPAARSSATSR